MTNYKEAYFNDNAASWAPSTRKPVQSRLALIPEAYLPARPQALYDSLVKAGYGAYTIKQVMLLAAQVAKHAAPTEETYTSFLKKNRRLFTAAYEPKRVPLSFEDALAKIAELPDRSRAYATGLIASGSRVCETSTLDAHGQVVGKGNRKRELPNAEMVTTAPSAICMNTFRSDLKKATGLTPHQLRKLAATKMAKLGAQPADLMAMFGWKSIQTASIYLQAENIADVSAKLKKLISV